MINCITIPDNFSPRDADNAVRAALLSGADSLIIRHNKNAAPFSAAYREKLLCIFRSAYRHKIKIYLSDDSFPYSGTAFGQMGSVTDLRAKALFLVDVSDLSEGESPLAAQGASAVVAKALPDNEAYPFLHYPDLTLPESAQMVLDFVYRPFLKEYNKFAGYEFAGFVSFSPCFASPFEDILPYSEEALTLSGCDPFAIFDDDAVKEKYLSFCQSVFEKNFLAPLKAFCVQNALSFNVIPKNKKSASKGFCERENAISAAQASVALSFSDIVEAFVNGSECMLSLYAWDEYSRRLSALRRFLSGISPSIIYTEENEEIALNKASELFVVNTAERVVKTRISIPKGEAFLLSDFESDSLYRLDSAFECEFSPFGFLYLIPASEKLYADPLPVSVSGVRLWAKSGKPVPLAFSESGGTASFTLPDEPIFGKCLDFEGDFSSLKINLGSMRHFLITPPFCVSLFDFCRGASCTAEALGGNITGVYID